MKRSGREADISLKGAFKERASKEAAFGTRSSAPSQSIMAQPDKAARLQSFQIAMISIGGIIGAGLFVGTSAAIAAAGPAVLLSYLGAGLIVWLVMRLLGGLAIDARGCGSFISHIEKILGPRAAFMTGWSYAFLWAVTAGAQAVAGGLVVAALTGLPPIIGALAFIGMAWGLNRLSLRQYGQAETVLSIVKLLFLAAFIFLGVGWLCWHAHPARLAESALFGHGGFFPLGGWAVVGAVPMIVQTFTGCEIAVIAAGDSDRPLRNIARTVRRLPLQVLFFYAGSVLVIVSILPWNEITPGSSPFLAVMRHIGLPFASAAAIAVTLVAVLSCLNSAVYVVSRILKELSALRLAPALLLRETKRGVPVWSLRLTTGLELVVVVCAAGAPVKAYPLLLGASGGVILFVYFMVSLAAWKMSRARTRERAGREREAREDKGPVRLGAARARMRGAAMSVTLPLLALLLLCLPSSRLDTLLSCGLVSALGIAAAFLKPTR